MLTIKRSKDFGISKWLLLIFLAWYPMSRVFMAVVPAFEYSTVIFSILIITYSLLSGRIVYGFSRKHKLGILLMIFLFSTFLGSLFSDDIMGSLEQWVRIAISIFLCLAVSGFKFKGANIYPILKWYSVGFSILCILSVIDYLGFYEIIGFNERVSAMVDAEETGLVITDISGPYRQRSAFSANLSICFPIALFYVAKSEKDKLLWILMSSILVGTTLLTFSRMVYLSLLFTILFYSWYRVFNLKFLISIFSIGMLLSVTLSATVRNAIYFGYKSLEGRFTEGGHHPGDTWRYDAYVITLNDLKSRPLGMGFSKLWSPKMRRFANPHSLYTSYFRAGGFIAIIAFLLILFNAFLTIKIRIRSPEVVPLICSVLSMMIYAVTHLAISIIFWCFIGLIFSLKTNIK
jgi:O-antigen ligase